MKKNEIRYIVDIVSLVSFIIIMVSGFVLWFVLPRGAGRLGGNLLLGIARHDWITIHNWSSIIFTPAIGIHLLLNLKWIVKITD